jgi:hypothetical protein
MIRLAALLILFAPQGIRSNRVDNRALLVPETIRVAPRLE